MAHLVFEHSHLKWVWLLISLNWDVRFYTRLIFLHLTHCLHSPTSRPCGIPWARRWWVYVWYRNLLLIIIISDRLDYRKFAAWKFCLVTTFWRGIGPWRITHLSCICIILFLGCGSRFIIIQCNGDDFIRIVVYEGKSNKCNRK